MSRVVEMLSASRKIATKSTVGKAENSSGFWIHNATIRSCTESAIDAARPKSINTAGTGGEQAQNEDDADREGDVLCRRGSPRAPRTTINDIATLAPGGAGTRRPACGRVAGLRERVEAAPGRSCSRRRKTQ